METKDECGIFGVVTRGNTSTKLSTALFGGLLALKHRGQESAGISVSNGSVFSTHKEMGTIDRVFQDRPDTLARAQFIKEGRDLRELSMQDIEVALKAFDAGHEYNPLERLVGVSGIAHTRYSTTGSSTEANVHPILFRFCSSDAAVAHNGNLVNVPELKEILGRRGGYDIPPEVTTDSAYIAALIATSSQKVFFDAFTETLSLLKGAFSLVALHEDIVYAAKDEFGLRPLSIGKTDDFFLVASETCALDTLGAEFLGEVAPGTALAVGPQDEQPRFRQWNSQANCRSCVFEVIYLSRPDSLFRNETRVYSAQQNMGRELARENPLVGERIDAVISVPDSGNAAALGCAKELSKPYGEFLFEQGIIRVHLTRSFIAPVREERKKIVGRKHGIVPEVVRGKNIVVVDDSIVRGNTMPQTIERLRKLGAQKIFVLIASPPLRNPCYLGVDLPTRQEFVANKRGIDEIREEIGADYLGYLSIEGLYRAIGLPRSTFCDGCMTNEYPIPLIENGSKQLIA